MDIAPTALVARLAVLNQTAVLPDGPQTHGLATLGAALVSERYSCHLGDVKLAAHASCFRVEVNRVEIRPGHVV